MRATLVAGILSYSFSFVPEDKNVLFITFRVSKTGFSMFLTQIPEYESRTVSVIVILRDSQLFFFRTFRMWPGGMMLGLFNAHKEYAGRSRNQIFFKLLGTSGTFPKEIFACF